MSTYFAWQMQEAGKPMQRVQGELPDPAEDEVRVRVAGCGVCHTDLGFFYEGIPTVKSPPLVLGHEISGFAEAAGRRYQQLVGKAVIVPAVLPCGECSLCRKGRGNICRRQKMPGNHIDGGFASHIVVPGRYLCPVEVQSESEVYGKSGVTLKELSVIADALTTPYQAIRNSGLQAGDLAVFIGVGGIGGFGVQLASALGAQVVAIDIDDRRLEKISRFGAALTLHPAEKSAKDIRKDLQGFAKENGLSPFEWKIFETSGTAGGQELAFGLLTFGASLGVVGFTMEKVQIRLSNLMAYDARAIGNWGCLPEYYPEVLELVQQGRVQIAPFVQTFSLSQINEVFEKVHHRDIERRPVMVP